MHRTRKDTIVVQNSVRQGWHSVNQRTFAAPYDVRPCNGLIQYCGALGSVPRLHRCKMRIAALQNCPKCGVTVNGCAAT